MEPMTALLILGLFYSITRPQTPRTSNGSGMPSEYYVNDSYNEICGPDLVQKAKFSKLSIGKLSNNFMESPGLNCLSLKNCGITEIEDSSFDELPNLRYLNVGFNSFDLNELLSLNFSNLEILVANFVDFDVAVTSRYQRLAITGSFPNLKRLFLNSCGLKYIGSRVKFPTLTHLDLSYNYLEQDDFEWLPQSLKHLHLQNNNLTTLTLRNLINLKQLTINSVNSEGAKLDFVYFENLTSLSYLSLPSNDLRTIDNATFTNLESLTYLDLANNRISNLDMAVFQNVKKLKYLNMANNNIEEILPGTFNVLPALEYLNLERNKIEDPGTIITSSINKLETLWLNCNRLKFINDSSFSSLTSLQNLFLHDNLISNIDVRAFVGLSLLKILTLTNNKLLSLPKDWILPLKNLEILDVSGNLIFYLQDVSLMASSSLKTLYLGRLVSSIDPEAMINMPKNVTIHMNDANNTFIQSCFDALTVKK